MHLPGRGIVLSCRLIDFLPSTQALVNSMLRADPYDRPSTKELLQMPFVRKHMAAQLGIRVAQGERSDGLIRSAQHKQPLQWGRSPPGISPEGSPPGASNQSPPGASYHMSQI